VLPTYLDFRLQCNIVQLHQVAKQLLRLWCGSTCWLCRGCCRLRCISRWPRLRQLIYRPGRCVMQCGGRFSMFIVSAISLHLCELWLLLLGLLLTLLLLPGVRHLLLTHMLQIRHRHT
jgi:hypothetical protein